MRYRLFITLCGAVIGSCAVACQPAERHVVHHVDPIRIEPIYVRSDINVKMERESSPTSQPTTDHAR